MYCPNSSCAENKRHRRSPTDHEREVRLCPACHSPLLPGEPGDEAGGRTFTLPRTSGVGRPGRDWLPVMEFSDHLNADLARSYLEAHGVTARVHEDDYGAVRPELAFGGGVKLLTFAEDAGRARSLLEATADEVDG